MNAKPSANASGYARDLALAVEHLDETGAISNMLAFNTEALRLASEYNVLAIDVLCDLLAERKAKA